MVSNFRELAQADFTYRGGNNSSGQTKTSTNEDNVWDTPKLRDPDKERKQLREKANKSREIAKKNGATWYWDPELLTIGFIDYGNNSKSTVKDNVQTTNQPSQEGNSISNFFKNLFA